MNSNRRQLLTLALLGLSVFASPVSAQGNRLELRVQNGHRESIEAAAVNTNGTRLLTGSADNTAILWDILTGRPLRTLAGHTDTVITVAWNAAGSRCVTGSLDGTAIVWEVPSGRRICTIKPNSASVNAVAFHPEGELVLTGTEGGALVLWDATTGHQVRPFGPPAGGVCSLAFNATGTQVVSGCKDKRQVQVWDVTTGRHLHTLQHADRITSVGFAPVGGQLATGTDSGTLTFWDIATRRIIRTVNGPEQEPAHLAWARDGATVLLATKTRVSLWNARTGERIRDYGGGDKPLHAEPIRTVAFVGEARFVTASLDGTAALRKIASGEREQLFTAPSSKVRALTLSADGLWLATGSEDGTASVWDMRTGRPEFTFDQHPGPVTAVVLSPDGKRLLTASENRAFIWTIGESKPPVVWVDDRGGQVSNSLVNAVAFTPDGKRIALGVKSGLAVVWDPVTKDMKPLIGHVGPILTLAVNPDGTHLVTGGQDGKARVWNLRTGDLERKLDHPRPVAAVAFSPRRNELATVSGDGAARVWDPVTGKVRVMGGQADQDPKTKLTSVAWDNEGRHLLTGSDKGSVIHWDAHLGKRLREIKGHEGRAGAVAFRADGRQGLTASDDGTTRIWELATGIEEACLYSLQRGNEWLVVHRDGPFDGSANAPSYLSVRLADGSDTPLGDYRREYYVNGMLASLWSGKIVRPDRPLRDAQPPIVRVLTPLRDQEFREDEIVVTAEAEPRGNTVVREFRLYLDGRPYPNPEDSATPGKASVGKKMTAEWRVKIGGHGKYRIDVEASTTDNVVGTSGSQPFHALGGKQTPVKPRLFVLAVGVANYQSRLVNKLNFAANDAVAIAGAFKAHAGNLYDKVMDPVVLTDAKATNQAIRAAVIELRKAMTINDIAVVFYSGHGDRHEGELYLTPVDADTSKFAETAISGSWIMGELKNTAGKVLLLLDACHSGAIDAGANVGDAIAGQVSDRGTLAVLASAKGAQKSREDPDSKRGMFTRAVVEAISGKARRNNDGAIELTNMIGYVRDEVSALTGKNQLPVARLPQEMDLFLLTQPK